MKFKIPVVKHKRFTLIDWVTILGIISTAALVFILGSGCATTFTKVEDPRECCKRLSLHNKEMAKFTRYCKVALFIKQSELKDKKVRDIAEQGVRICKYVLTVSNDHELMSLNEDPEKNPLKVRSYIYKKESFWMRELPCDPAETFCEEF